MIVDPVTIRQDRPVRDALNVMERYHISGVPVVDEDGHLVGIITNRDLRFESRFELAVSDVEWRSDMAMGVTFELSRAEAGLSSFESTSVAGG